MLDACRQLSGPLASADELLTAVRARKDALALSNGELEELAGFCDGTVSKYLGPSREKVPGLPALYPLLAWLGCCLVLVDDADAARRIAARWTKRSERNVRDAGRLAQTAIRRALPAAAEKLAKSGCKARWRTAVARPRQRRLKLSLDHALDKAAHLGPDARFNRIEPVVKKLGAGTSCRM